MQQRILAELAATRWDDSPPLMTTPADSPIVIHGSDSEDGGRSHSHHSTPVVLSPAHSGAGIETLGNGNETEALESTVSNRELASTAAGPSTTTASKLELQGAVSSTTDRGSDGEDEEIRLFADDTLIDHTEDSKHTRRTSEGTSGAVPSNDQRGKGSNRTDFKRKGSKENGARDRERENGRHHKRRHSSPHKRRRTSSRDPSHHHHRRRRREHRPRSKSKDRHNRLSRIEGEASDPVYDAYCHRESDRHRSRLYSDDIASRKQRRHNHHRERRSCDRHTQDTSSSGEGSSSEGAPLIRSKVVVPGNQLMEELECVDEKLKDNKKQLLKSLLRKERIQLLHRSLHGESLGEEEGGCEGGEGGEGGEQHRGRLEVELASLNRAIASEKTQLLHVMMRMEDQLAEDSDQD